MYYPCEDCDMKVLFGVFFHLKFINGKLSNVLLALCRHYIAVFTSQILNNVQTTSYDLEFKTKKRSPHKIPLLQKGFLVFSVLLLLKK